MSSRSASTIKKCELDIVSCEQKHVWHTSKNWKKWWAYSEQSVGLKISI